MTIPVPNTTGPADIRSYVDLLRLRAEDTAAADRGYTFLLDGDDAEARLSFAELDRRARAIGARLQQILEPGERALLLFPPGLDYVAAFFGCLYAEVIAVPAYPPDPSRLNQTLPRIQSIIADSQVRVILSTREVLKLVELLRGSAPDLAAMHWEATDTIDESLADVWQASTASPDDIAFLQYTSGSTGEPKGAVVTHGNLLHNSAVIHECFGHDAQSRGVIWLPPYHDMGLIGGLLQPLYGGFPVVLMSPVAFLMRPIRWLKAITRFSATTSGGPNFAYDLCVRRISPAERESLDLSSWRVAFNGAEPVRTETLQRFNEAFGPRGFEPTAFLPCYGLAESTLFVTGTPQSDPPTRFSVHADALQSDRVEPLAASDGAARQLISSGRTWSDHEITIVDPELRKRCAPNHVGEIWLRGSSVVRGYWNSADEQSETFEGYLANTSEGPFLRTGDLGFINDGELYVAGRLKDLVVIRGKNHYPHDIETTAEKSHLAVRPGRVAAFSVDHKGEERLVVVCELRHHDLNLDEVCARISGAVAAQHGLRLHTVCIVHSGNLPKTSSGKLQRRATRRLFLEGLLREVCRSGKTRPVVPPIPQPAAKRRTATAPSS